MKYVLCFSQCILIHLRCGNLLAVVNDRKSMATQILHVCVYAL